MRVVIPGSSHGCPVQDFGMLDFVRRDGRLPQTGFLLGEQQ
jgi:hypothetical protein